MPEPTAAPPTDRPPRVWAVLCYRAGENAQILALAEALGWPFEVKTLAYRKYGFRASLLRGTGLSGIDVSGSSPLTPPWPDLVISAAFRNEPVIRWIQRQAGAKRVRYVHVGRPWARPDHFDLVIAVPEYRLADHPNVLQNHFSLYSVRADRFAAAAARWAPRLAALPRPWIGVFIGGYSGPYTFDRLRAEQLGRAAGAMARQSGGSLLVSTSFRTAPAPVDTLAAAIDAPAHIYRWKPNDPDNPYFAYLALADAFIVTCDSATMLAEACATRKPVYMFDLGLGGVPRPLAIAGANHALRLYSRWSNWNFSHVKAFIYWLLLHIPPQRMTRDIRLVHDYLIASGRAVWLGQPFPPGPPPPPRDTERAVARIRAWFEPSREGAAGKLDTVGAAAAGGAAHGEIDAT